MTSSHRSSSGRKAGLLDGRGPDQEEFHTTTWPDGTTEVVAKAALEPHEQALLDSPEQHAAISESLENLHLAAPLDEDLIAP